MGRKCGRKYAVKFREKMKPMLGAETRQQERLIERNRFYKERLPVVHDSWKRFQVEPSAYQSWPSMMFLAAVYCI